MKERYLTITGQGEAELVEKRSRFIASVRPVQTENEALAFLAQLRQKYWDASHNVYAYILQENNIMRYSDDGEPSGTAGMPVLDMLKKEGLTNLIVVVTRYFGGTLLGTGGLVHAYSKSAKMGIEAAGYLEMILCRAVTIRCAYPLLGKIQNELSKWDLIQKEPVYTDLVELSLCLPVGDADRFIASMVDITNSQSEIFAGKEEYQERIK